MDATLLFFQGAKHLQEGRLQEALEDLSLVILHAPDIGKMAYALRGEVNDKLGRFQEALEDFSQAILHRPHDADAYFSRGKVQVKFNRLTEALEDYSKAILYAPDFVETYHMRGAIHYKLNHLPEALIDFSQAIRYQPDYADSYFGRGVVNNELDRSQEALKDFSQVIFYQPDFPMAYHMRAVVNDKLDRSQEALEDFSQNIFHHPDFTESYYGRALICNKLGDELEVKRNLTRFIALADRRGLATYITTLVSFFGGNAYSPYLLKHIFNRLPLLDDLSSFKPSISENEKICKPIDLYLDYLSSTQLPEKDSRLYGRIAALTQYLMGNPIRAYQIFNDELDYYDLSLWEQYYYVQSAHEILEPPTNQRGILDEAFKQAGACAQQFRAGRDDLQDLYYAGKLFYIRKQLKLAHYCFNQANDFLPAAYMQVLTLQELNQGDARHTKIQEIREREQQLPLGEGYLNGFGLRALRGDAQDDLQLLLQYAHYVEILTAISAVRVETDPAFSHLEFYQALALPLTEQQQAKVRSYVRDQKAERLRNRIQSHVYEKIWEKWGPNSQVRLKSEIEESVEEVYRTFQLLEEDSQKGKNMEVGLARLIADWKFARYEQPENIYFNFIFYFHLKGLLISEQVFTLLYFTFFTQRVHHLHLQHDSKRAETIFREGGLEATLDTAKEYVKSLFSSENVAVWLALFPISGLFVTCFLSSAIVKTVMNFALSAFAATNPNQGIDSNAIKLYHSFKGDLFNNLGYLFQFGSNQYLDEFSFLEYEKVHRLVKELEENTFE